MWRKPEGGVKEAHAVQQLVGEGRSKERWEGKEEGGWGNCYNRFRHYCVPHPDSGAQVRDTVNARFPTCLQAEAIFREFAKVYNENLL